MLSTICGSLANTTIFAMGDRDYLMIRVMLVSPSKNFLGKFIYKIVTEFVFYFIILIILGEPVFNALMLCIVTACARPVGEMMAIITFDHFRGVYENRSVLNGTIMAICVILHMDCLCLMAELQQAGYMQYIRLLSVLCFLLEQAQCIFCGGISIIV